MLASAAIVPITMRFIETLAGYPLVLTAGSSPAA
jgi:hypothetical protein